MTVGGANPNGIGSTVPLWAASVPVVPVVVGNGRMSADASEALFTAIGALALPAGSQRSGFPIVSYAQSVDQGVPFELAMPFDYVDADLTVTLFWTSPAIVGSMVWDVSFERNEAGHNIDTPAFAAPQSTTVVAPAVSGDIVESPLVFTNAEADGVASGNLFRLLVTRNGASESDEMADAAQLIGFTIR